MCITGRFQITTRQCLAEISYSSRKRQVEVIIYGSQSCIYNSTLLPLIQIWKLPCHVCECTIMDAGFWTVLIPSPIWQITAQFTTLFQSILNKLRLQEDVYSSRFMCLPHLYLWNEFFGLLLRCFAGIRFNMSIQYSSPAQHLMCFVLC